MRRIGLFGIVVVLLLALSAAAPPEDWRDACKGNSFASRAIWDFDQVSFRLSVLLDKLQDEGELAPEGAERIRAEVERIEYDYIVSHCGPFSNMPTGVQINRDYDQNYRQPVSGPKH
jgi:hypothetical protein